MACSRWLERSSQEGFDGATVYLRRLVVDQVTGLLVPMGDAQAMAESICRLLEHPEQARSMGGEGRKRFLDHFTIQNTAANVEKVYDDFLPPLRVS